MVLVLHSCYLNVYMDPLPSYPLPTSSLSSLLSSSNHQEQAAVLTTQSPVFLFEKNSIFSMCILIVLNKNGCCFWCLRVSAKLRNKSKVSDTLFHVWRCVRRCIVAAVCKVTIGCWPSAYKQIQMLNICSRHVYTHKPFGVFFSFYFLVSIISQSWLLILFILTYFQFFLPLFLFFLFCLRRCLLTLFWSCSLSPLSLISLVFPPAHSESGYCRSLQSPARLVKPLLRRIIDRRPINIQQKQGFLNLWSSL